MTEVGWVQSTFCNPKAVAAEHVVECCAAGHANVQRDTKNVVDELFMTLWHRACLNSQSKATSERDTSGLG